MTNTLTHPGPFPYMATIAEENDWLMAMNDYDATTAAERGDLYYLKATRNGGPAGTIYWSIKECMTDRLVEMFEDRSEALKALDALEAQS